MIYKTQRRNTPVVTLIKKPTDTSFHGLLASEDWKMLLTPVDIPSRIKSPMPPSDPNYLIELTQSNPAIKELVDSFELEIG